MLARVKRMGAARLEAVRGEIEAARVAAAAAAAEAERTAAEHASAAKASGAALKNEVNRWRWCLTETIPCARFFVHLDQDESVWELPHGVDEATVPPLDGDELAHHAEAEAYADAAEEQLALAAAVAAEQLQLGAEAAEAEDEEPLAPGEGGVADDWRYIDDEDGARYYVNVATNETAWTLPSCIDPAAVAPHD